eukprot:CAMPEP_0180229030 /NCGR_PEP_ID=MMETSP0987-20121128/25174_1 /TAXON_ID=697907 /ORGANISM="non described non described, Strain CCMP2293" /LENGTH=113 /DNA_ID=CAMNT_0022193453 /DNA_START=1 /DNA_END=339 /DNA_ORIENTATION=-
MWNWVRIGSCVFFWMGVNQVMLASGQRLYPDLTFNFDFSSLSPLCTMLTANLPFLALLFQNFQNGSNASNGSNLSSGTNSGTFAEFPAAASPGGEQAYTFLAAELAGDSWGFS